MLFRSRPSSQAVTTAMAWAGCSWGLMASVVIDISVKDKTGKVLADTAAAYIRTRLGGRAKVVLLTHDNLQFLAPRFTVDPKPRFHRRKRKGLAPQRLAASRT